MPEADQSITDRMSKTPGLYPLLAEAEAVWRSRTLDTTSPADGLAPESDDSGSARLAPDRDPEQSVARPGWRPFEDAFPTFYQFTNRPPR